MPDRLNKHEPESSKTLDPTVDESAAANPFQKIRDEAIVSAFSQLGGNRCIFPGDFFDAFRAGVEAAALIPRVHRIGAFDYDSLVECLKSNFELAFHGYEMRDPQDAIQMLAATVMYQSELIQRRNPYGEHSGSATATLVKVRETLKAAHYVPALDEHDPLNDAVKRSISDIENQLRSDPGYRESGTESSTGNARACSNKEAD